MKSKKTMTFGEIVCATAYRDKQKDNDPPAASAKLAAPATTNVVPDPSYGPLVDTCRSYGIPRTTAFRLASLKRISVFKIGRRTYVIRATLESLPERLNGEGGDE